VILLSQTVWENIHMLRQVLNLTNGGRKQFPKMRYSTYFWHSYKWIIYFLTSKPGDFKWSSFENKFKKMSLPIKGREGRVGFWIALKNNNTSWETFLAILVTLHAIILEKKLKTSQSIRGQDSHLECLIASKRYNTSSEPLEEQLW
jgi:hypothetical protein